MIPYATVRGSGHGSVVSAPASNARTTGAQPADCAATNRVGGPVSQPSSRSSANAFAMPISPTPPPVG